MGALRKAQFLYDNAVPAPDDGQDEAERIWVDNGAEQLLARRDVTFQRRLRQKQGVTFEQFAVAVDEFVMGQLGVSGISNSVLGRLVLASRAKVSSDAAEAADEILAVASPEETLREIARTLLRPLAKDGVLAEAEESQS